MSDLPSLNAFSRNVYSQFGEDGIIEKIFAIIGMQSKVCVEFGAWDGFYHANTAKLWSQEGWKGVLIEPDDERFGGLEQRTKQYGCICIHSMVENDGPKSLDALLTSHGVQDIDLVSIDIDGDDYQVFESLKKFHPRLVICEYNPTIPKNMDLVAAPGTHCGSSSRALVRLGEEKGYKLIAMTDTNCFFVTADDFLKFSGFDTDYGRIATEPHVTYLITDYEGNYALSRKPPYGLKRPLEAQHVNAQLADFQTSHDLMPKARRGLKKIRLKTAATASRLGWHLKMTDKVPNAIKTQEIRGLAKKIGARTFVEVGAGLGDTLFAVKDDFAQLYGSENDDFLFDRALKRFAPFPTAEIIRGDGATFLPKVLGNLTAPTIFWLNGDYSSPSQGFSSEQPRILQELATILDHGTKPFAIIINSAQDSDGLRSLLRSKGPTLNIQTIHGILVISPTHL